MRKTGFGLVKTAVVILIVACANNTLADSVFDHFDDGVLDPAWNITFENVSGWTYSESGTQLNVTDMTLIDPGYSSATRVNISQPFTATGDFSIECAFSWDSDGLDSAMQVLGIELYNGDEKVIRCEYYDPWVRHTGAKLAIIGTDIYNSGENTLPLAGNGIMEVNRVGNTVTAIWDGGVLLSANYTGPIDKVSIDFRMSTYAGGTFGSFSVDYISAETVELARIQIVGPNEVAEQSSTQYTAIAVYDNNSTKDITGQAYRDVHPDNYADIYSELQELMFVMRTFRDFIDNPTLEQLENLGGKT